MTNYFDIVNQSIAAVVTTDELTHISYLEPLYKEILKVSEIEFDESILPMEDLYEILRLEVKKRNAVNNKTNSLTTRISEILEEKIDPVVEADNMKLMQEFIEYLHGKDNKHGVAIKPVEGIVNFAKKQE